MSRLCRGHFNTLKGESEEKQLRDETFCPLVRVYKENGRIVMLPMKRKLNKKPIDNEKKLFDTDDGTGLAQWL